MLSATQFRYGVSVLQGSHMAAVMLLPLVLLLLALGIIAFELSGRGATWGDLREAFGDVAIDWELVTLAIAGALAAAYVVLVRKSHLQFGFSGIDYYVPRLSGLGLTGVTTGRARIPWNEVKSVRLLPCQQAQNPAQRFSGSVLEIEAERGALRFCPFNFVEVGAVDHRLGLGEVVVQRAIDVEARLLQCPVIRALTERGFAVAVAAGSEPPAGRVRAGFDLTSHKGLLAQLVVVATAGAYAVVELVLLAEHQWLGPMPWLPMVAAGAATVGVCAALGRGAPPLERLVVMALAAGAVAGAVYPGVMRVNLSTAAPQTVTYTAAAPGLFMAPNHPAIDLQHGNLDEYWAQYPAGAQYDFVLLRGRGGVMVDLRPVYEQTRAFYADGSQ